MRSRLTSTAANSMPVQAAVLAAAAAAALALGACGAGDAPPSDAVVERDSAGIRIVENRAPAWTAGEAWRLADRPSLDIGAPDGPPEQQLFRVTGAVRLSDGRIVVANGGTRELKFYDAAGSHLRTVGGEGGGPGEFDNLSWLGRTRSDTLLVWDNGARRLSTFDPAGEFVSSVQAGADLSGFLALIVGVFDDGSMILRPGESAATFMGRPTGELRDTVALVRFDRSGAPMDTVGRFAGPERFVFQRESGFSLADVFFGRETFTALRGDRLFVADSDRYEVAAYDAAGELRALVRRTHEPVAVRSDDVEAVRDAILAGIEGEEQRRRREEVLAEAPSRETLPAIGDLVVDRASRIWLEAYRAPGVDERRWSVFDADGRWLGSLEMPVGLDVLEIGESYVLGVERDAFDVEYVRLYEVVAGEDGA
ncbi:MAG: hypothetical protein ACODAE_01965 [Gemmatimonadota bacterium]